MRIQRGDTVKIRKGKDVGKQGKVLKVLPVEGKVIVEGINIYKRHIKGDNKDKESAIVDVVKPVSISNVMVVCNSCGKPSRIGFVIEKGKKIRICKKCMKPLDAEAKQESSKKTVKSREKKTKRTKGSTRKKINSKAKNSGSK